MRSKFIKVEKMPGANVKKKARVHVAYHSWKSNQRSCHVEAQRKNFSIGVAEIKINVEGHHTLLDNGRVEKKPE